MIRSVCSSWMSGLLSFAIACSVGTCGVCAMAADPPQQVDVYVSGHDGYHTYRIPSVIVTKQGTVLAFCEGRKHSSSDTGDIDLLVKRSSDGGRTFSKARHHASAVPTGLGARRRLRSPEVLGYCQSSLRDAEYGSYPSAAP